MGEFQDKELEKWLNSLPKIEDHRSPSDIYRQIEWKMKRKKRRSWIISSVASVAALLLLTFLYIPQWLQDNDFAGDFYEQRQNVAENEKNGKFAKKSEKEIHLYTEEPSPGSMDKEGTSDTESDAGGNYEGLYSAVYDTDISGYQTFIYPIPDKEGQIIVPVTVLAKRESDKNRMEQFEELMPYLKEEEWGLSDYFPINGKLTLSENDKNLHVDLPPNHQYGEGSSAEHNFIRVMHYTADMFGAETITFSTAGNAGVNFGHTGFVEKMQVQKEASCGYYFYYPSGTEKKPYIVPSGHSCQNIREALAAMKNNVESERLQASIPENFLIREVAASGDLLIMRLDERAAITDDVDTIYTIEAILLTAKDFQFKRVRMENANIRRVGKFEFGKDWPVPVGPNLIRLEK